MFPTKTDSKKRSLKKKTSIALAAILVSLAGISSDAAAENWPQFRGANLNGVAQSDAPTEWTISDDQSKNIAWKIPMQGEGWSSPVVWDKSLFLTAAVPVVDGKSDSETKPVEYSGGGGTRRDDLTKTVYRYEVICLDATTGQTRWRSVAAQQRPPISRHSSNTYATETPITDGERVYAYFGMTGVFCFDMEGKPVWQRDLGAFEMRAGWGTSSSPVLHEGKLFIQVDNEVQSFLVALDAETGDEVWRVNRDERSQYSSPIIWENSLRNELILGGMYYRSYDPETGKLLWELDMRKGRSSATPIAIDDRLYVGTEFRNRGGADDGGGLLFCVKPGGSGDISVADEEDSNEFIEWMIDNSNIQMASPTVCDGRLYFLERRSGNLHCINAATGELEYSQRVRGARSFWASPISSGDRVYCVDAAGTTHVIAAGPDYQLISSNPSGEQAWSTPTVVNGNLYLRTIDHLYCIEKQ